MATGNVIDQFRNEDEDEVKVPIFRVQGETASSPVEQVLQGAPNLPPDSVPNTVLPPTEAPEIESLTQYAPPDASDIVSPEQPTVGKTLYQAELETANQANEDLQNMGQRMDVSDSITYGNFLPTLFEGAPAEAVPSYDYTRLLNSPQQSNPFDINNLKPLPQTRTDPYQFRPDSTKNAFQRFTGWLQNGLTGTQDFAPLQGRFGQSGQGVLGSIIYGLGLPFNATVGLLNDASNVRNKVVAKLPKPVQRVLNFNPLTALDRAINGNEQPISLFHDPNPNDSDFINALRGNQQSFSAYRDEPGAIIGIRDRKLGLKWWQDPGFVAGLGIDMITDPADLAMDKLFAKLSKKPARVPRTSTTPKPPFADLTNVTPKPPAPFADLEAIPAKLPFADLTAVEALPYADLTAIKPRPVFKPPAGKKLVRNSKGVLEWKDIAVKADPLVVPQPVVKLPEVTPVKPDPITYGFKPDPDDLVPPQPVIPTDLVEPERITYGFKPDPQDLVTPDPVDIPPLVEPDQLAGGFRPDFDELIFPYSYDAPGMVLPDVPENVTPPVIHQRLKQRTIKVPDGVKWVRPKSPTEALANLPIVDDAPFQPLPSPTEVVEVLKDPVPGTEIAPQAVKKQSRSLAEITELAKFVTDPDGKPLLSPDAKPFRTWKQVEQRLQSLGEEYQRMFDRFGAPIDLTQFQKPAVVVQDSTGKVAKVAKQKKPKSKEPPLKVYTDPTVVDPTVTQPIPQRPKAKTWKERQWEAAREAQRQYELTGDVDALTTVDNIASEMAAPDVMLNDEAYESLKKTEFLSESPKPELQEFINESVEYSNASHAVQQLSLEYKETLKHAEETLKVIDTTPDIGRQTDLTEKVDFQVHEDATKEAFLSKVTDSISTKGDYVPIYEFRNLPEIAAMPREAQDALLYQLQRNDLVEISSLVDPTELTPEQFASGIPQDIGGPLFYITPNKPPVSPPKDAYDQVKEMFEATLEQDRRESIRAAVKPQLTGTFYHGTKVQNLNLESTSPIYGGKRAEFGPAHYLTTDYTEAVTYSQADLTRDVPMVPGRSVGDQGQVLKVELGATYKNIIDGNDEPKELIMDIVMSVVNDVLDTSDPFDNKIASTYKKGIARLKKEGRMTMRDVYDQFDKSMAKIYQVSPPVSVIDNFQRTLNAELVANGYKGVMYRGDDDIVRLAVFDGVGIIRQEGLGRTPPATSQMDTAINRFNADSKVAKANQRSLKAKIDLQESAAALQNAIVEDVKSKLDDAIEEQVEATRRMLDTEEQLVKANKKAKQDKLAKGKRARKAQAEDIERHLGKPNDNPCSF